MIFAPQLLQNRLLVDEFDDEEFLEFAIDNYSAMFGYINTGRVNIRIHRDIEGNMWFGLGLKRHEIGYYILLDVKSLFGYINTDET